MDKKNISMMIKTKFFWTGFIIFLVILNTFLVFKVREDFKTCRSKKTFETCFSSDPLVWAARQTHMRFKKAHGGIEAMSGNIPRRYWAKEIKDLHPLRVYSHEYNVVVVQKFIDNVEEGKYIHHGPSISSRKIRSGDDGFTFSPIESNSIYNFKRVTR